MFDIIAMGDYVMLSEAFNGLAMIFNSEPAVNMMKLAFLIGILAFGARAAFYNKWDATPLLAGFIAYLCMFGPKVTITVTDGYTSAVRVVANVPVGLAAPMSITSHAGRYFASTFEQAFAVVTPGTSFYTEGYLNSVETLLKMRAPGLGWSANVTDSRVEETLVNYLRDCVYFDLSSYDPAAGGSEVNPQQLAQSTDTWAALRTTYINIYTTDSLFGDVPHARSCDEVYTRLNSYIAGGWVSTYYDNYLQSLMGESRQTFATSAENRIANAMGAINLSAADARNYMVNSMLQTALRNADAAHHVGQGNIAGTIMVSQAANQRNVKWAAEKTMFEQVSRPITAFIELFMVGAAPIMAFAVGAFGHLGFSLLTKFLLMHVWVSLWVPCSALVNVYMTHTLSKYVDFTQTQAGINLLSQAGLDQFGMQLQTQYATGGMLAAAVPLLTLMLIYGTSQVATSLAGKMAGSEYVDAKQAAPNVADSAPWATVTSSHTLNPEMQTRATTGGAIASMNMGSAWEAQARAAATSTMQWSQSATEGVNKRWGLSESAGDKLSYNKDGTLRGEGRLSKSLAANYNNALAAAYDSGMRGEAATSFAIAANDQYLRTVSGGVGAKAGVSTPTTPGAIASAGFSGEAGVKFAKSFASSHGHQQGVNEANVSAAMNKLSQAATKDDRLGVSLDDSKALVQNWGQGKSLDKAATIESARTIGRSVTEMQSSAQAFETANSLRTSLSMGANLRPSQAFSNLKQSLGGSQAALSRIDSNWDNFFSNAGSPQQQEAARSAALERVRSAGIFKNDQMSNPAEQAGLEKMMAMAMNSQNAPDFLNTLGETNGVSLGSVTRDMNQARQEAGGNLPRPGEGALLRTQQSLGNGSSVQGQAEGQVGKRQAQAKAWSDYQSNNFNPESLEGFYLEKLGLVNAKNGSDQKAAVNALTYYRGLTSQDQAREREALEGTDKSVIENRLKRFRDTADDKPSSPPPETNISDNPAA